MQKFLILLVVALCTLTPVICDSNAAQPAPTALQLYRQAGLEGVVDFAVFERAYEGFTHIEGRKKEILTLVDFSKPSTLERLWVIDLRDPQLLFHSHVAHGKGSGGVYATSFSNLPDSHKSSLGFYLTAETYMGDNGYSLRLDGLEKGVNDRARERAVVIHGADYANPAFIASGGRLGRSLGCPALPPAVARPIIDRIKEGSVLYIYAPGA